MATDVNPLLGAAVGGLRRATGIARLKLILTVVSIKIRLSLL